MNVIADIPKERIVYIDETGIDSCLHREYCHAKRGKKIYSKVSGKKYKRTSIVAGQMGKAILAPLQYSGTMDSSLFETWFSSMLLASRSKESIIVMDNAAFHRKSRLICIAKKAGYTLIFLPQYSPELNPIENFWAWLKSRLRKILPHFYSLDLAISDCFKVH